MEMAVRQQLRALLAVVVDSKIQASLVIARTDWISSVKRRLTQMIKKVAFIIIISLLLQVNVSVKNRMLGKVQSFVDSQLSDTDCLVSTVRTQVERFLSLQPQQSPHGTQPEYSLKNTVERNQPG